MYFKYLGKTGEDLNLDSNVLMEMSTKDEYLRPLLAFKYRTLCCVTHGDKVVPYCSAAIRPLNPYKNNVFEYVKNE